MYPFLTCELQDQQYGLSTDTMLLTVHYSKKRRKKVDIELKA